MADFSAHLAGVQDLSFREGAQGVRFNTRERKQVFYFKCALAFLMCFHHSGM